MPYTPEQRGFSDAGEYPDVVCPSCGKLVRIMTKMDEIGRAFYRLWCPDCHLQSLDMIPAPGRSTSKHQLARWAMAVRARAKGKCQLCGADGIHAHHIIPKWKDKSKALDLDNGIFLCGPCHAKAHQHDSVGIHPDLAKYLTERKSDE